MTDSPWILDVNQTTFAQEVLERSRSVPVVVDFWAPWCGPCRTLGPILEKLALETPGRFLLVKINSDQNPALSQKLGVKGIPAVKLFLDGQMVDEFTGALPESQVRRFLDEAIPSEADNLAAQGVMLEQEGATAEAFACYRQALEHDPKHDESLLGMARVLMTSGRPQEAAAFIERLSPLMAHSPDVKAILAQLAFSNAANPDDEALDALRRAVETTPGDLAARMELGRALVGIGRYEEAMEQFLAVVRQDRQFDEAAGRVAMVQVFDLLGFDNPLTVQYRAKLSAILFS
ncbi:MAG: co-chaperone YbbN [Magnetococcales bacterium]|nr:co-chaperone YbbN [Magnetococcales bacterium]